MQSPASGEESGLSHGSVPIAGTALTIDRNRRFERRSGSGRVENGLESMNRRGRDRG